MLVLRNCYLQNPKLFFAQAAVGVPKANPKAPRRFLERDLQIKFLGQP